MQRCFWSCVGDDQRGEGWGLGRVAQEKEVVAAIVNGPTPPIPIFWRRIWGGDCTYALKIC